MKLLLTGAFQYTEQQLKKLKYMGHEVFYIQDERIPLKEQEIEFSVGDIEGVVCNGLFLHNDINDFSSLKHIQLTSAGYDRVPMEKIHELGIEIYNAKGVYSTPMAEWAILSTLLFYKNVDAFKESQTNRIWKKERKLLEIARKRVLILGTGNVGNEVAKRFKAFDAEVIGVDKYPRVSSYIDEIYSLDCLEIELQKADIVVLTLPLTEETYHLLDRRRLFLLKENAVLINISRGKVIDENALISQLNCGRFLGVALDVFEEEPLAESSPLWNLKNVRVTPHNSFVADGNAERMFKVIATNLKISEENKWKV